MSERSELTELQSGKRPAPMQHPFAGPLIDNQMRKRYGLDECLLVSFLRGVIGLFPNCRRKMIPPSHGAVSDVTDYFPLEDAHSHFSLSRFLIGLGATFVGGSIRLEPFHWQAASEMASHTLLPRVCFMIGQVTENRGYF